VRHVVLGRFARKLADNKGTELILIPRGHIKLRTYGVFRIQDSHSGGYEEFCHLGYNAV
jgi:hypothetical protein